MKSEKRKTFNPKKSLERAKAAHAVQSAWMIESEGRKYKWASTIERVGIIRQGMPYGAIEVISKRIDMPVKDVLHIFSMPQTTYNKKKKEQSLLGHRDSETVLLLTELIDFGIEVFDGEQGKFQRWLKKKNVSLGGNTPESLLDSITGIREVKNSLNRLEFGNLA